MVEDEALILINTVDELEDAGCEVLAAPNATLAVRLLESRSDVTHLFSDIDLPGEMDGLQLAALARQRWPTVRILLTSGHMLPHTFAVPDQVEFFPKPYRIEQVRASIVS